MSTTTPLFGQDFISFTSSGLQCLEIAINGCVVSITISGPRFNAQLIAGLLCVQQKQL